MYTIVRAIVNAKSRYFGFEIVVKRRRGPKPPGVITMNKFWSSERPKKSQLVTLVINSTRRKSEQFEVIAGPK